MKSAYKIQIKTDTGVFEHKDRFNSPRQAVADSMRMVFQHQAKGKDSGRYYDNQMKTGEFMIITVDKLD